MKTREGYVGTLFEGTPAETPVIVSDKEAKDTAYIYKGDKELDAIYESGIAEGKRHKLFSTAAFFATMISMLGLGIYAQYEYPALVNYKEYFAAIALILYVYAIFFSK